MREDLYEVTRVIYLCIDGCALGNADKLNEAFHARARWFGTLGDVEYDLDKAAFVALMTDSPSDSGELKATITDIKIAGNAAMATVKEEGYWGTAAITEFLTLSILAGEWQITCKTFVDSGGEHA